MSAIEQTEQPELARVRATVNLAGLPHNTEALVDPKDPYIKGLLRNKMLVRVRPARAHRPAAATDVSRPDLGRLDEH